jgi:stage V sporulation protein AA
MAVTIYIRLRHKFSANLYDCIKVGRMANVIAPNDVKARIDEIEVYHIRPEDNKFVVIDAMDVIKEIHTKFPDSDIQTIGSSQTIIEVQSEKKRSRTLLFLLVWILLFIGAGLTIMNFHEDVAMSSVHQKIYYLVTGRENSKPLVLQIPYSLGVGIGMILFFNHIFKKRFNEEPSPLEVEMFNYQQDLDRYIVLQENKKVESKRHHDG